MPYVANQYNYATPLSGSGSLSTADPVVTDRKYFTLANNVLDGSYYPVVDDVGLWGSVVSDADGNLSEPYVLTVSDRLTVNAYRLHSSQYGYPVAFTVQFYNGNDVVFTITETNNTKSDYVYFMTSTLEVTGYIVTITKISAANEVVKLYKSYGPWHVKRVDTAKIRTVCDCVTSELISKASSDKMRVHCDCSSHIQNNISITRDALRVKSSDVPQLTNVHTRMKEAFRRIYGKVYITYTDPMLPTETRVTTASSAYNSETMQVLDDDNVVAHRYFTLYDNDLSGRFVVSDPYSQVGWVSGQISDAHGEFSDPAPFLRIDFAARPVLDLSITFDDSHGSVAKDFTVEFISFNGSSVVRSFVDNTSRTVTLNERIADVVSVIITVTSVTKPYHPVGIVEAPLSSTILYVGYQDKSDLISIDLLEELTYDDEVEALGGVSANEVTVALDNSSRRFFFNNPDSVVASSLKRNRKVVPWLGVEIVPGQIEWHTLGTYWSYAWDVPVESLRASVTAFDTLGLLDKTSFTNHHMQINKSIGQLIEYVLDDAKSQLDFITYKIDPALYDIMIPYAWFEASSHTAALRKISGCFPAHIYCDRAGTICAAPQKLHLDFYYDTWSDHTNVISKKYSSLFTTLPNIINVNVIRPKVRVGEELTSDDLVFNVTQLQTRTLNFTKPYISGIRVTVDCDSNVSYTYSVYSWGIVFSFSGTGNVRNITCAGTALDISRSATLTRRNEDSVSLNGAVTRDIKSDFIQTVDLANELIERLLSLSQLDKFDADVEYRGDIALTINDPILLLNGIAPDNRYNIKRHELSWNGSLIGSAHLNT